MLSGCISTDVSRPCVFPFIYEGRTYKLCTDINEAPGRLWCSTTDNYDRDAGRVSCACSTPDVSSIFYTTDGSEPTLKSSVYNTTAGMQLYGFGERTVKVKNFKQGYFDSPIMEALYSILPQMVSTMAGSSVGVQGFQDGFGTFCAFSKPTKLVISPAYTYLYITDTGNDRIRQFNMQSGFTSTLAGGLRGFSDGVGTNAQFDQPYGLALTRDGRYLYVGDSGNGKIRKIDVLTGSVQTLFTLDYAQTRYLFKRSEERFKMMSTNDFLVERTSRIHESKWVDGDQEVQCTSTLFTDSKGYKCTDYDEYPQWCGFEHSAYACCACGGGTDVSIKVNASVYSFKGIRDVKLSLDEKILFVLDVEQHTVNEIVLSTGQVRVLAGGGINSKYDTAYGTLAGFSRPFGMDVSQKTASKLRTAMQ